LRRSGIPKILRAEFSVATPRDDASLRACGLIAINPPWTLERELQILLPELAKILSGNGTGNHRLDWLAGEL
jgi:23S rRNA (adenine2030-N6)-methyltransferase